MSSRGAWLFPIVGISFQRDCSYAPVTWFQSVVPLGFYVIVKYYVASKFAVFNIFHPMISRRTTLEILLCIVQRNKEDWSQHGLRMIQNIRDVLGKISLSLSWRTLVIILLPLAFVPSLL